MLTLIVQVIKLQSVIFDTTPDVPLTDQLAVLVFFLTPEKPCMVCNPSVRCWATHEESICALERSHAIILDVLDILSDFNNAETRDEAFNVAG